jgi:hypothetical protein
MTQARTRRHREDRTKSQGIHYTPEALADFLARRALDAVRGDLRVALDPACGGGELLEALARNVGTRSNPELWGFDTDPGATASASERLRPIGAVSPVRIETADFLDQAKGHRDAELFPEPGTEKPLQGVDLVIANPPYVRTQTMGQDLASSLAKRYGLTGRVDLFTAFAFAMSDVLRDDGVFALLCSNRFLTTKAGEPLRRLLSDELTLLSVTDFGDSRLFGAAVLPVVVIARKGRSEPAPVPFVSTYRTEVAGSPVMGSFNSVVEAVDAGFEGTTGISSELFEVRRGTVPVGVGPSVPWTMRRDDSNHVLRLVERSTAVTVKDLVRIRVGIKTTADPVFIRDDWSDLPDEIQPEPSLLRPLLTHHVAGRWSADAPTRQVLYTHTDRSGRAVPVDLDGFPKARAYLETHRDRLAGRKYVTDAGRAWFEIWVPQKPNLWAYPKVVFPDIAESPKFFLDTSGAIVNGDCYWAKCESDAQALLIAAVGNSKFARWFYDAQCGNQLYAGRRRFMTQYVERFPVPDPLSAVAQKIVSIAEGLRDGHGEASVAEGEIEALIAESLGVEEPLW